jgi:hypothetical protein
MNIIGRTLDIGEDRRRLDAFSQTHTAVPLDDVKSWVASWGSTDELPPPGTTQDRMILVSSDAVEAFTS